MQNKLSTKKGFTLIEIVIALAIAALIIVIVLLAVGGAQQSQRNNGRREVANRFRAAITDAIANCSTDAACVSGLTTAQVQNAVNDRRAPDTTGTLVQYTAVAGTVANGCTPATTVSVDIPNRTASVCLEGGSAYVSR